MGRLQFKVGCGGIWRGQGFTNNTENYLETGYFNV